MKVFRAKARKNLATMVYSQTSSCQNRTCSPELSCWPEHQGMGANSAGRSQAAEEAMYDQKRAAEGGRWLGLLS